MTTLLTNYNLKAEMPVILERGKIARNDVSEALFALLTGIENEDQRRNIANLLVKSNALVTLEEAANELRALKNIKAEKEAAAKAAETEPRKRVRAPKTTN